MTTLETSLMQPEPLFVETRNGASIALDAIPTLSFEQFSQVVGTRIAFGQRVSAFFALPELQPDTLRLYIILADDEDGLLYVGSTTATERTFTSMAERCPQLQLFEREIAEQYGIQPLNHPWFKPVRYHHSSTKNDAWGRSKNAPILPAVGDFYRVDGEQVHEVAVGPVHAGIIEPGHFRFQCYGEEVFHLEIALGYQHRGIEKALLKGPDKRTLHYMENIAGDSAIAHGSTYGNIIEALSNCQVPPRALALRGIALELERLANHTGDLGALSADIGFLPTASYCGRIRGDFLNMSAVLCGNRFGRGLIQPGGVHFDLEQHHIDDLLKRLDSAEKDTGIAINLLWDTQSVMARFEHVGEVSKKTATELGLVGPAARASGLARDVRHDHSTGIYCFAHIPVQTASTGDVFARAYVRWIEMQQSIRFIKEQLRALPKGAVRSTPGQLAPNTMAIALTEGWRGEVCHVAITSSTGSFTRYKVVDPSFHNWSGLAMALRNQQISDFPICNKSFNLSYCGFDL